MVFLTVSVWTSLLYRIMSKNCCDDLEQIPLDDSPCHFFARSRWPPSCTAWAKQFSAQGQGLLRFLSENRCLAGDDLYLGKFKDDSMPISRSHKRAAAGGGTRQKSVIFHWLASKSSGFLTLKFLLLAKHTDEFLMKNDQNYLLTNLFTQLSL